MPPVSDERKGQMGLLAELDLSFSNESRIWALILFGCYMVHMKTTWKSIEPNNGATRSVTKYIV